MTKDTMKCECPEGYPKSIDGDFGVYADLMAEINRIEPPRFGVTVHTGSCPLPDEPHTIPEDYSHPKDKFGIRHREPSLVEDRTTS